MTNPAAPPSPEHLPLTPFERKLEDARRELLETSVRSRLLHTPLGSARAKIVEIRDELSDEVFRILVREAKAMTFLPTADDAEDDNQEPLALAQPDDDDPLGDGPAARHVDTKLQTGLSSTKLQTRLRSIAYDAQSFENEQGVNILYIALGFLKWYEAKDVTKPRYAPLVLIPVTLSRASVRERFKLAYSGEEIGTNLSLQQRLHDEGIELPSIPDAEDLSPTSYAAATAGAVADTPHWEVLTNAIALGFFSFAKLMMYRDLDPDLWPLTSALRNHEIIKGLLGDGFHGGGEALIPDDAAVDAVIDISTVGHVVDADSSQMLAIEDVRRGHNLVIQGPPGTGKSQTITNLIAAAVRDGKRVLFVAEKMAALNVVRRNLGRIDLGQTCLELHSHKAKKKVVLEDLEQTYQLGVTHRQGNESLAADLRRARDTLSEHAKRIHTPLEPSTATPYEIFGKLARLSGSGVTSPDFQLPAAQDWTRRDAEERTRRVTHLAAHVHTMGVPAFHPWRGMGLDVSLPQDVERVAARARRLTVAITDFTQEGKSLAERAGMPCETLADVRRLVPFGEFAGLAPSLDVKAIADDVWTDRHAEITVLIERGASYALARHQLEAVLLSGAWNEDLSEIARQFTANGRSWFRWLRPEYRKAVRRFREFHQGPAPKLIGERLAILGRLAAGQRARKYVQALDGLGQLAFGSKWNREDSDWDTLQAIDRWAQQSNGFELPSHWRQQLTVIGDLAAFSAASAEFAATLAQRSAELGSLIDDLAFDVPGRFGVASLDAVSLDRLSDCLTVFAASGARFQEWCAWRIWSREASEAGLNEIVDRLSDGRLAAERAPGVFQYAYFEVLARQAFAEHRDLALFDGRSHERILADFKNLDRQMLACSRREIQARHVEQMPRGNREVGEVGILAREWRKQRRHLPLRRLIKASGRAMQLIKPVWMMSPMSLAQFVAPGTVQFDLVLMDEASQIRPVEALGAIARARQVVVVGDDKQLPPTSFFDRVAGEDTEPAETDDFQAADIESILGLCSAQGIPDRMLRWHYRSQHESLIAVSNLEFYKRLFIVPSAESEDLGLRLTKINGIYDRGKTATNRIEARAIAQAVIDHARRFRNSARFPEGMSLGVGTFSVAQRDAILDELELLWRDNPDVAPFFGAESSEPFFVKNLESIQGDERDVVMISVGYGPDAAGYVTMGFGPLSAQGGERRLNVLISRARRRCEVFSSITAADIDLARTQSIGVRVLKTFLQYAEKGYLDRAEVSVRPIDSDFEEDVGMSLANLGYLVQHQVGVAGFFVDLAIKDPARSGRYLLGIECDGAAYHSSRSARDRDRLREQVLVDRGWRIHRIWSTDWFKRRDEELTRVIAAIEAARAAPPTSPVAAIQSKIPVEILAATETRDGDSSSVAAKGPPQPSPPYIEAEFVERFTVEPHQLRRSERVAILRRIIEIEGPIHEEEIGRRYATVCGKDRAGSRIQEAVSEALVHAAAVGWIHADGSFYTLTPLTHSVPRDRSRCRSITVRKPEMLAPVEIQTGLRTVVADHVGVEPPAAIVEVARMLGFQRTGAELYRVIEEHLRDMLGAGVLLLSNGDRLYLAESIAT
jgi:very-short-patch-repair endonuclease